jgi:hypothetical protein
MEELGIRSIRGLAARTGISPETARRVLTRSVTPEEATLQKLAEGLPASLQRLRRLAGRPAGERTPFVLPPEADQLDDRQRSVVLGVVHALLDASTAGVAQRGDTGNSYGAGSIARLVGRSRDPAGLELRSPNGDTP